MPANLPSMTIVMPNFNEAEFVSRAIDSVLAQDYPRLQFIIVDDGSTDRSVDIIRSYGDRITLIVDGQNRGHAAAVNTGFRLATGEVVSWINSNDSYLPGALLRIGDYFCQHPEVSVIYGDFNIIDVNDRVLLKQRVLPLDYVYACMIGFGSLVAVSTLFMRKHVLDDAGLLDETYLHVPDNEFIFRIARRFPLKKLGLRIANWRQHPTSITRRGATTIWEAHAADVDRATRISYNTLPISRLIPYEQAWILRAAYKVKRVFQRILRLHYVAYVPVWLAGIRQRWSRHVSADGSAQDR